MFSLKIVDTDAFLDMPQTSQLLYYSLAIRADDDGFVSNPKKIMRMLGSQEDDYKVLVVKKFVIPFESGVCVIKHWLIHNLIRGDRYVETQWTKEKGMLSIDDKTKKYSLSKEESVIPDGNHSLPQVRSGQVRLVEDRERTPSQIAREFFDKGEVYEKALTEFSQAGDPAYIENEFKKFWVYWTEPNKSGTKVRWQQEPTFEIRRRLVTWFDRSRSFNKSPVSTGRGLA